MVGTGGRAMDELRLLRIADTSPRAPDPERSDERNTGLDAIIPEIRVRMQEINQRLRELAGDPSIDRRSLIAYAEGVKDDLNAEHNFGGVEVMIVGQAWKPLKIVDVDNDYINTLVKDNINSQVSLHSFGLIRRSIDEAGEDGGPQIGIHFTRGEADIPYFDGNSLGIAELSDVVFIEKSSVEDEGDPEELALALVRAVGAFNEIGTDMNANGGYPTKENIERGMRILSQFYALLPSSVSGRTINITAGFANYMYKYDKTDGSIRRAFADGGESQKLLVDGVELIGFKLPAVLDVTMRGTRRIDETHMADGIGLIVRINDKEDGIRILPSKALQEAVYTLV